MTLTERHTSEQVDEGELRNGCGKETTQYINSLLGQYHALGAMAARSVSQEEEVHRLAALLARLGVDVEQASTPSSIHSDLTPFPSCPPTPDSSRTLQVAARTTPPPQNILASKDTQTTTEGLDDAMPRNTPDLSALGDNRHILAGPKPGGVHPQPSIGSQRSMSNRAARMGDQKDDGVNRGVGPMRVDQVGLPRSRQQ
ncbi:hypothetical protein VTN31DRAFT_6187 [Thermomyces dupontii]|uniref:uncharacterized protein n=1 Tax=Talaromyces thermophilus TaxID=28565 RepID=UPI003743F144